MRDDVQVSGSAKPWEMYSALQSIICRHLFRCLLTSIYYCGTAHVHVVLSILRSFSNAGSWPSLYRQALPQNTTSADQLTTDANTSLEYYNRCTRPTHIFLCNFRGCVFEFGGLKAIHAALSNWLYCFPGVWMRTLAAADIWEWHRSVRSLCSTVFADWAREFLGEQLRLWRATPVIKTHATIFNVAPVKLFHSDNYELWIFLKICSQSSSSLVRLLKRLYLNVSLSEYIYGVHHLTSNWTSLGVQWRALPPAHARFARKDSGSCRNDGVHGGPVFHTLDYSHRVLWSSRSCSYISLCWSWGDS